MRLSGNRRHAHLTPHAEPDDLDPDGPGYYRKNGNDVIKLIPGVP